MTSPQETTDYKQLKEIFAAALDLAAPERAAFLDEHCPDKNIRSEVESLLQAHGEAGKFLEDVSAVKGIENSLSKPDKFIGRKIDKYTVEREIGRGGMGAVYLASRSAGDFKKLVAVKIIKRGSDSDEALKRFGQERQILAALEHPNIARLIDGGTTDDETPYLLMEYVEGVAIDEFCARRDLSIEAKLRLFQKICAAVAHAHRNLTIHRDLKSANVLVTAEGEPKLLDFGIAKLFSDENSQSNVETVTGFRALTPEYASPEQLRGEKLTTATDVYSLGVILYELLTGTRPFATGGKNFAEVLEMISEIQPPRPSSVNSKFKIQNSKFTDLTEVETNGAGGRIEARSKIQNPKSINSDIDNIVLKALSKEPGRRYGSVEQFSEDIERYLKGLPVAARKDSFSYRSLKFIKRNPVASAVTALFIISLISGFIITFRQYQKAQIAQTRAERRFNDVRQLSNAMLFELNDKIEKSPTEARAMIVEKASGYLDKLNQESVGDISLQIELVNAYLKVGDLQGRPYAPNLGDINAALVTYQKAADLIEPLLRSDSENPTFNEKSADVRQRFGEIYSMQRNRDGALKEFTEVMRLREKVKSLDPQNPDYLREEADAEIRMGDLLELEDDSSEIVDYPAVIEHYERAFAVFEDLAERQTAFNSKERFTAASVEQRIGLAFNLYARLTDSQEKHREAVKRYSHVLATIEKFAAAEPDNLTYRRILIGVRGSIAEAQTNIGNYSEALENYRQIESVMEQTAAADNSNIEARLNLALLYVSYGEALGKAGRVPPAVEKLHRGIKISESILPGAETRKVEIYANLMDAYFSLGEDAEIDKSFADSTAYYRKSLDYCEKLLSENPHHWETLQKKALLLAKIK